MTPKQLLFGHRYDEAVEAYRQEMRAQPDNNLYDALGDAFLGLRQFEEALKSFKLNDEIESSRTKKCFPSLNKIGTSLWLMRKQREAMSEWHRAAAGILDGSIHYGDLAGGGTQGLLLWYGAITLNDDSERDYALEYLQTIAKKKSHAINWPRPIILMVLGDKSFAEVLEIGSGSTVLSEFVKNAATDLLKRRRLCQTLFYAACQDRQAGNEVECIKKMRICSQLENPILESEWYLARREGE